MENVPTITVSSAVLSPDVTFIRWKAHSDWVTKVNFTFTGLAYGSSLALKIK